MSRYDFTGVAPDTRVTIGWDRPLQTFFVHVVQTLPPPASDPKHADTHADTDGDTDGHAEERLIVWVGTGLRELPYAADAIHIARKHAVLPSEIGATLEMDRLRTVGDSDGPAQQAARQFLSRSD